MNVLAGIWVILSSFSAVSGDGRHLPRRMRETWTRLTESFGAMLASVSRFAVIQACRSSMA